MYICIYMCVCMYVRMYVQIYSSFPDTVIKSVHLNYRKDCNNRPTGGKRNAPSFFLCAYLISALCVLTLWHDRRQTILHSRTYRQQQIWRCSAGHQDRLTSHHATLPYGDMLRTLPPLPKDLPDLRRRIIAAISEIQRDMLQRVWAEVDYQLDVCSVTNGGHIEHSWCKQNKTVIFSFFRL